MSHDGDLRDRAHAAQDRLRGRLRKLATASDPTFDEDLSAVVESIREYDVLLTEDRERVLRWPVDARERIARCQVELRHLQAGRSLRKDAIGMVRLVIPRFEEDRDG